jgi:RNA polymerase sigma factor (sigma-70 family)
MRWTRRRLRRRREGIFHGLEFRFMAINRNCSDGLFRAAQREPMSTRQTPTPAEVLQAVDQALASTGIQKQILRLGLQEHDVADAGQDVKLSLLKNIARMDQHKNFHGYVYRAVSNGLTSIARSKYRTKTRSLTGRDGESSRDVVDDRPTPLEQLATEEERWRLLAALRKGPPRVRRMVDLRLAGLSFEQIGRKVGLSAATVFRALREQIEQARRLLEE